MSNYSNQTRGEQVFNHLRTRINTWVDGTELANEQVGGSEGLKRLRELRQKLRSGRYEIEMRSHPDPARSIFQYRLVERTGPASPVASVPLSNPYPDRRGHHLAYDKTSSSFMAAYDGPVIEPTIVDVQGDMGVETEDGLKYVDKPSRLDFGKQRPCPKCHGIHRALKEKDPITGKASKIGKVIGYEDWTRDPQKPSQECPRCNGFGMIPT